MSPLKIYRTGDCSLAPMLSRQITVVGFGSQGKAFALNLRDSGCNVQVALRESSSSRQQVFAERLPLRALGAVGKSDVVVLAIPDHEQPRFYETYLSRSDKRHRMTVFLHGLNVHFGNIHFSQYEDVVLIAPHGPGDDLRRRYVSGGGLSCFIAVDQNASGKAHELGLSLAAAIGADKAGIFETTFKHETIGDLFGEQTLLVGGLAGLTMTVFQTMINNGLPPENAYLETVQQLRLLAAMVEQHGPAGMIELVSKTAAFGSLRAISTLFDDEFQRRLLSILQSIESGEFNKQLLNEAESDFRNLQHQLKAAKSSAAQKTSERFLRKDN